MTSLPRTLHPALNAPGYMATAGAVYAAATMIYNAYNHHGVISVPVILAAVAAVGALLTRTVVTPVADPVDGAGRPLVPASIPLTGSGATSSGMVPPNMLRAEAGLPPLPPVTVVPPQPAGLPHVIFEDAAPPGEAKP